MGKKWIGRKHNLMNVINGVYPNGDTEVQCEGLNFRTFSSSVKSLGRTKYVRSIFKMQDSHLQWRHHYEEMIF